MPRDPLMILSTMRRLLVEQARYALGGCQTAQAEAEARIRLHDDAARRDRAVSAVWENAVQFTEISAVRLEHNQTQRRRLTMELAAAEARSDEARGVVTAARTAAEAVGQLMAERAVAKRVEVDRREQHVLDDTVRARSRARQHRGTDEPRRDIAEAVPGSPE